MLKNHGHVLAPLSRLDMPIFSYFLSNLTSKGIMLSTGYFATVYGTLQARERRKSLTVNRRVQAVLQGEPTLPLKQEDGLAHLITDTI